MGAGCSRTVERPPASVREALQDLLRLEEDAEEAILMSAEAPLQGELSAYLASVPGGVATPVGSPAFSGAPQTC